MLVRQRDQEVCKVTLCKEINEKASMALKDKSSAEAREEEI